MKRLLSLGVLGLALTGAFFWTPATSQAQTPVGVGIRIGDFGFSFNQGYPYAPYAVPSRYVAAPFPGVIPGFVPVNQSCIVPTGPYPVYSGYGVRPVYPHRHHDHHHHHQHRR